MRPCVSKFIHYTLCNINAKFNISFIYCFALVLGVGGSIKYLWYSNINWCIIFSCVHLCFVFSTCRFNIVNFKLTSISLNFRFANKLCLFFLLIISFLMTTGFNCNHHLFKLHKILRLNWPWTAHKCFTFCSKYLNTPTHI